MLTAETEVLGSFGKALGEKLRKAREERGLSQRDLANASGVSKATISRIERGKIHDPAKRIRAKLVNGLTGGTAQPTQAQEQEHEQLPEAPPVMQALQLAFAFLRANGVAGLTFVPPRDGT
jgi:transcriptional regulator with XRE-family HTH domain